MKKALILTLLLVGLVVLAGCGSTSTSTEDTIKIGTYLALTGGIASYGQAELAGIELAVQEYNANGGINGQQIELIVEDDMTGPESVDAVQKLITIDQVIALIGPTGSASAGPSTPIVQNYEIPNILLTASAPDLTYIGDYIFRVYPSDSFQGKEAASFMKEDYDKVAVVYVKNDWGQGIKDVFIDEFENLGGEVVYESGVLQEETDFKTEIEKITATDAEALYFAVYPNNAVSGFKQMEEYNFDLPIIGGDTLMGTEVTASGYGDGTIFIVSKLDFPDDFAAKINAMEGYEDLDVNFGASLGYDAANILFEAIESAGTNNEAIRDALKETSYAGVSSPHISFDEAGDIADTEYEYYMISNGESVPYFK
jgi:branched-chain amino acid transport system substrate-binding protein